MLAETLISAHLPVAAPTDRIADLVAQLQRFQIRHLPVVVDHRCLGMISGLHLNQLPPDDTLAEHLAEIPKLETYVQTRQHFFDVIELMNTHSLSVVPVCNELEQYMGAIAEHDVVRNLNHLTASDEPGFIVVLEMARQDYSLTEIAGIVESNNARIISLYLSPVPDAREMYVNLKITGEASTPIILSFERFGYQVGYVFTSAQEVSDTQERYDALMRYLNI